MKPAPRESSPLAGLGTGAVCWAINIEFAPSLDPVDVEARKAISEANKRAKWRRANARRKESGVRRKK